ncbi:MAG: histidine kinase dimerization/phospho-acceptor domain-containing protein [Thiobacillus sp.]|uniref:two-component system sensor histidine kinase NtrB n=1 Tax=Thiobacillus sp. TaxID=924 RepID=UPI002894448B|nr:ATP-binding protein [Thiobacillus sp.]MDT3705509.1 histidine kinase dimerization/phospho-acceptor domain-containing protein [Thiobacillus sp.]
MRGTSSRRFPLPVVPGRLVPAALAVLAGLLYLYFGLRWHASNVFWIIGAMLSGVLGYLFVRLLAELAAVRRLELGIHAAREGLLEPTPVGPLGWTSVGRMIPEYNTTIATLRQMFRTVEECQGRFLNERNRSNTILQSLPGALLSVSDDLRISIANRQADALFGVEAGRLIGIDLFGLLDLNERDRELLRDAFLYKHAIRNQEIALNMGGCTRYFSLNLSFYNDEENDMGGVLILQDITEYRQLMESVATREKLVAMGQLAAGVAHELNTPLGNILGYAQLLDRGAADHPKLGEYARIIADETQRCSHVVRELLNYARKDQCSGETCDLNQLAHELIETFINCRLKRYRIEVVMDLSPGKLVAEGSCGQFDIVLTNLLINAIDALDKTASPRITVSSWAEESYACIGIADNGPGVPPDIRNRLFDPFFSTKEVGQGSGLGLSISQAMVAKRGGFIAYDADYQEGARFVIKLPAVDLERARL